MGRVLRRRWPWVLCVLLILACMTVWWFPARWAWSLARDKYPEVHIASVHGSVWDGRAERMQVAGKALGTLRWQFGRSALWGKVHGDIALKGPLIVAEGHIKRAADGTTVVSHGHFRLPLQHVPLTWPDGKPLAGMLVGQVKHARLVRGWPAELDATVTWQDAAVIDGGARVALGTLVSHWRAGQGGVIRAEFADRGDGPVRLKGSFAATLLGWRVDATLRARDGSAAVGRVLARLGKPDADGSVQVHKQAGLFTQRL